MIIAQNNTAYNVYDFGIKDKKNLGSIRLIRFDFYYINREITDVVCDLGINKNKEMVELFSTIFHINYEIPPKRVTDYYETEFEFKDENKLENYLIELKEKLKDLVLFL